jgi:ABC-type Mn2+/Zn2+ transport system ATPase subunit
MAAQIAFRDVTLGYDRHPAVHHLDGQVAQGALLAVVGPNGAGKSTLFRGLAGILKPLSGSIDLGGLDIRDIAYLPQSVDIDRTFPISVFDLVGTGLWRRTGFFGGIGKAVEEEGAEQQEIVEHCIGGERYVARTGPLRGKEQECCDQRRRADHDVPVDREHARQFGAVEQ